jgi:hypothetical protein
MTIQEQITAVLRSRKFWVLALALLGTLAAYVSGQVTVWQALQAGVSALAVYSAGVAIEDGAEKYGRSKQPGSEELQ